MKKILATMLLLASTQASFGQLSGPLSGTLGPGVYTVVGDISVGWDDSLRILPGTTFDFLGPYSFTIIGILWADGTASDSINFTTDIVANQGGWRGLRFPGATSLGSLSYCAIRYARQPEGNGGGILCESFSSVSLRNCTITDNSVMGNGGGIYCREVIWIILTNCIISGNGAMGGGGIFCEGYSSPTFSNCMISNNWAGDGGGVYCMDCSQPTLDHCCIEGNWVYSYGGGVYCDSGSSPTFTNCDIRENSASGEWWWGFGGGIYCERSSPTFVNCRICENGAAWGGSGVECSESILAFENCIISGNSAAAGHTSGAWCYNCSGSFINCTFSHNDGYDMCCGSSSLTICNSVFAFGSGILFQQSPQTQIGHCDFFGDYGADFTFWQNDSSHGPADIGELTTTNANGDSCDAYRNIFLDPSFAEAAARDFRLLDSSRCIGAGDTTGAPATDIEGNPRPNPPETSPDIGAYENERSVPLYARFSLPYLPVAHALHPNWPNPFNASTTIRYDVGRNSPVQVTIYDLLGQEVQTLASGKHPAGSYVASWNAGNRPSGIYFCRMEAPGFAQVRKLMLVK